MRQATENNLPVPIKMNLGLPLQTAPLCRPLVSVALADGSGMQPSFDIESALAGAGAALLYLLS